MKIINQCLLLLLLIACSEDTTEIETNGSVSTEPLSEAIPVKTYIISSGAVADAVEATGSLFPIQDVMVSAETGGKVVSIDAEVGQTVAIGKSLIKLDPEIQELAVEQAEARVMEVKAAFNKALRDFERNKKLFETRDISEYMFENIRLQRESAEAALKMAEANLQLAQRQLNDCTIESPIDGIVATRLAEFGNTVAPGTPLMKVVNIMSVRLKFGVAEKDVARITAGQPASALIPALPGKTFDGTVTAISPQADLTTRTFPVEVTIENRNYELKAGMAATVRLVSPDRREFPLLPKSALIERGGETIVYVVKNGRAEKRMPELGPESGDSIAVIRGVEAGEEVVVLGQENLIPGSDVRIKN